MTLLLYIFWHILFYFSRNNDVLRVLAMVSLGHISHAVWQKGFFRTFPLRPRATAKISFPELQTNSYLKFTRMDLFWCMKWHSEVWLNFLWEPKLVMFTISCFSIPLRERSILKIDRSLEVFHCLFRARRTQQCLTGVKYFCLKRCNTLDIP